MQDKDFEQKTREQFYQINRELADHTDRLIGLENKMDMVINTQQRMEKDITEVKTRMDRVENEMTKVTEELLGVKNEVQGIKSEMSGIKEELRYNSQLLKEFITIHKTGEL